MLDSDLKFILGSTYNDEFFTKGSNYRESLEKNGILIFNSFISDSGLNLLQKEANDLKQSAFRSSSEYNVYISEYDDSFPENSSRNRIMSTTKKCIPNDLIPKNSILQKIYDSSIIKSFFLDLLNKDELHPYEDDLSSININYYDKGDALGWHFDNSDFTITLLVKNCSKGGVYEFFNDIRYKENKEDYDFVEKILDKKVQGTTVNSIEGDLMIFKGNKSIHQVTAVEEGERVLVTEGDLMIFKGNKSIHQVTAVEEGERVLVTFNYNETTGISLSEQSRRTFFGRIK